MELLIPLVFLVAILELVLSGRWNRMYFIHGIPAFRHRVRRVSNEPIHSKSLQNALEAGNYSPIKVRSFNQSTFGFREALWGGFGKMSYTPVMRGKLEILPDGRVEVTGLLNWFTIVFTVAFVSFPISWGNGQLITFILPLFLFGLLGWIYSTQRKRFREVTEVAAVIDSDT